MLINSEGCPQSFAAKFQAAALKAGNQAQSFGKAVAAEAQSQSQKTMTGFKLENEVSMTT